MNDLDMIVDMSNQLWNVIEQELAAEYDIDLNQFHLGSIHGNTSEDEAVFYHNDSGNIAFVVND